MLDIYLFLRTSVAKVQKYIFFVSFLKEFLFSWLKIFAEENSDRLLTLTAIFGKIEEEGSSKHRISIVDQSKLDGKFATRIFFGTFYKLFFDVSKKNKKLLKIGFVGKLGD